MSEEKQANKQKFKTEQLLHLCKTIIHLNKKQRITFLANISKNDCKLLQSLAYNILLNSELKIKDKPKVYLNNNITSLRKLASKLVCVGDKRNTLQKKHLLIKKIALIALDQ